MSEEEQAPQLSEEECENLVRRIRPAWFNPLDRQTYYLVRPASNRSAKDWSFNDSLERQGRVDDLKAIFQQITYHQTPPDGKFRPTFGEVVSVIRPEDLHRVAAFRTVPHPDENDKERGLLAGLTTFYARR